MAHCKSINDIDGIVIRHTCDTPLCINTAHLIPGTSSQNMNDRKRAGRVFYKLTREDAAAIKVRLGTGELLRTIAADYGVSLPTISKIRSGRTWRTEDLPAI
jgi:hypothetical protein